MKNNNENIQLFKKYTYFRNKQYINKENQIPHILSQIQYWVDQDFSVQSFPISKSFVIIISQIKFSNLRSLNLIKCTLQSVQFLTKIDLSRLQKLNLVYNYINKTKSIRKCNLSNLHDCNLGANLINQNLFLQETLLSITLNTLSLDYYPEFKVTNQNINFISKLHEIEQLNTRSSNRILQKTTQQTLKRKFMIFKVFDNNNMGHMISDGQSDQSNQN